METRICRICEQEKPINQFGKNAMYLRCGARDGINIYCKACRKNDVAEMRAKWRERKKARQMKRYEMRINGQTILCSRERVLHAIRSGCHSRESIKECTKLNMDELVDVLADLTFERGELRIVKKAEAKEFHLAA